METLCVLDACVQMLAIVVTVISAVINVVVLVAMFRPKNCPDSDRNNQISCP